MDKIIKFKVLSNTRFNIICTLIIMIVVIIPLSTNSIFAENEIEVSTISFENSGIIEFHNYSEFQIKTIRMWLNNENSFESFKVKDNWDVKKTENEVLVLTLRDDNTEDTSVKIGIVTSVKSNGVNWKVINKNGEVIKTDITPWRQSIKKTEQSIDVIDINKLKNAKIRFIPEKIRLDSNFRIIGEKFERNETVELFIGNQKIKSINTDSNGGFVDTVNISENITSERNDVLIKDTNGNKKEMSIRVHEPLNRIRESHTIPLSIDEFSEKIKLNDVLRITGKSTPEKDVIITITNHQGKTETSEVIMVNSKGEWVFEKTINDHSLLGKKEIRLEDGETTKIVQIDVVTDKKIQIKPVQKKYESGEKIIFEGIVNPNQELTVILENSNGVTIFSDIIEVDNLGKVSLSFETSKSDPEGTYVLTASQGNESEIILVGIGVMPEERLIIKMDSLNYSTTSKPIITIRGTENAIANLLIIDPSDKEKLTEKVQLDSTGKAIYELNLNGYSSGAYIAVIARGGSQDSILFTVGLQTGSGPINASTTKDSFKPSESILIIGNTGKNTILTITLVNPNGEKIKEVKTFSDKDGKFSNEDVRIPTNAISGIWKLNIKSGGNYIDIDIEVVSELQSGMIIQLDNNNYRYNEIITLSGSGAIGNRVFVTVFDPNNNKIIELNTPKKDDGTFTIPWKITNENELGEYTVEISDNQTTMTITFNVIK